jgi:hypothetical protein
VQMGVAKVKAQGSNPVQPYFVHNPLHKSQIPSMPSFPEVLIQQSLQHAHLRNFPQKPENHLWWVLMDDRCMQIATTQFIPSTIHEPPCFGKRVSIGHSAGVLRSLSENDFRLHSLVGNRRNRSRTWNLAAFRCSTNKL